MKRKIIKKKITKRKQPRQLRGADVPSLRQWILEKKQSGRCAICDKVVTDPCLDHSHKKKIKGTGLVRGVLCRNCNTFIAKSENNCIRYGISQADLPRILRSCAEYLERPHYPYIHPSEKEKDKLLKKSSFNTLVKRLRESDYRGALPEWPDKDKPKVKLTKKLESFYKRVNLEPEFYQS